MKIGHRRIDAHDWVRNLRIQYYRVSELRNLRVGDTFWLGYFSGASLADKVKGHCEAYIERKRGCYTFHAIWTMKLGKVSRAHIITYGSFKLLPGNVIEFADDRDVDAEKAFRLVCRYIKFIVRNAKRYGIDPAYISSPYFHDAIWHCETVTKEGVTKHNVEGPVPRGLSAIVEVAIALGVVREEKQEVLHA